MINPDTERCDGCDSRKCACPVEQLPPDLAAEWHMLTESLGHNEYHTACARLLGHLMAVVASSGDGHITNFRVVMGKIADTVKRGAA